MNTQNLTPDQQKRLEQFKAQGVPPAHLERMAARYEANNAAPQRLRGATQKETHPGAIRGIEGGQGDASEV